MEINNQTLVAFVGSPDFILEKISPELRKKTESKIDRAGKVVALCLINDSILIFHFLDEIRSDAKNILTDISNTIDIEMLTGDHNDNAESVANLVGIKSFHSDVTPDGKLDIIKKHSEKESIIMVGDGINDAPALTFTYVGIAMEKIGSHTAI